MNRRDTDNLNQETSNANTPYQDRTTDRSGLWIIAALVVVGLIGFAGYASYRDTDNSMETATDTTTTEDDTDASDNAAIDRPAPVNRTTTTE